MRRVRIVLLADDAALAPGPRARDAARRGAAQPRGLVAYDAVATMRRSTSDRTHQCSVVPNSAAFIGIALFGQGFPLDPAANPFGFTATNGGRIKVGV